MADIDLSLIPAKVTITNSTGKTIKVNCSGFCQSVPVLDGQAVIFKAESSSELIGFLSQETDGIDVTYEYWTAPQA